MKIDWGFYMFHSETLHSALRENLVAHEGTRFLI